MIVIIIIISIINTPPPHLLEVTFETVSAPELISDKSFCMPPRLGGGGV